MRNKGTASTLEERAALGPEGIAAAKTRGACAGKGRRPSIDAVEVRRLWEEGMEPAVIAKRRKIGRTSVYRGLGRREDHPPRSPAAG